MLVGLNNFFFVNLFILIIKLIPRFKKKKFTVNLRMLLDYSRLIFQLKNIDIILI